jgi:hypothetical protein
MRPGLAALPCASAVHTGHPPQDVVERTPCAGVTEHMCTWCSLGLDRGSGSYNIRSGPIGGLVLLPSARVLVVLLY